ncbi:thrombospondin type 3 repeat-containing protein [Salinimicrobium sp. TH3]|uniref:thrombospondin type 3 repeat-containing protein n=1 Tax=Salinimicrobium sp. TH3 TaxID=2997342 RepID=UPI0022750955|nr:thrombospondin type 3 repeat-containing protein [Salinimicrobium sp. TH3]MCY2686487.1 thrombospondin type 3 repeat-containing protein [Salinimicrobium sp. TH3]
MKNFKNYLAFLSVFALLFTSCSKDEPEVDSTNEKSTLSFGAIVEDLVNNSTNKQFDIGDLPECSNATPSYVEIVLMQGDKYILGEDAPYRVDLVTGQVFTEEDASLELVPGEYSLEHFAVYDAQGDLTWIAPKGGVLAEYVDTPLPLTINLGAGVKKYVDVSVICYDDRDVNQYGYQFFEFNTTKAFEFCFFANYCTPEGKHYPARYSVEFSVDGKVIYEAEENINNVGVNTFGDNYADPICFALPDLARFEDDVEYLDYKVTLLDSDGVYDAQENTVITGSLSRNEVKANFDGNNNVNYEHLRFGCDGEVPANDADDDGVQDANDNCPNMYNPGQEDSDNDGIGNACDNEDNGNGSGNENGTTGNGEDNGVGEGCETAYMVGDNELNELGIYNGNNWGWGLVLDEDAFDNEYYEGDGVWRFPFHAAAGQNDTTKGWEAGHIVITRNGDTLDVDFDLYEGVSLNESHIYVGTNWPEKRAPGQFDLGTDTFTVGSGPLYIIVHAEVCGTNAD